MGFVLAVAANMSLVLAQPLRNPHDHSNSLGDIFSYFDQADLNRVVPTRPVAGEQERLGSTGLGSTKRVSLDRAVQSARERAVKTPWLRVSSYWGYVSYIFYYSSQATADLYDEVQRRYFHFTSRLHYLAIQIVRAIQARIGAVRSSTHVGFGSIHVRVGDRFPFPFAACPRYGFVFDTQPNRGWLRAACMHADQSLVTMAEVVAQRMPPTTPIYVATNMVGAEAKSRAC